MTKEELSSLREEIDQIDTQIAALFEKRLNIADQVAKTKRENNIAITDFSREQQIVERVESMVQPRHRGYAALFMRTIMALSKDKQRKELFQSLPGESFLPPPKAPKREGAVCAYQGVPGAWSEQALYQLFPDKITAFPMEYFEDVFVAVKQKQADYGVLPIENSQTGAIGEVYDLLRKFGLYIVGQTTVNIRHCLIVREGTSLKDIREIFSHPEGFRQCNKFLKNHSWDLTSCRNTAVAAQMVRESQSNRTAAIGSPRAALVNGLQILFDNIVDMENNRTRFVLVAAEPEYDEKSSVISVTFSTAHRSGALCESLLSFMAGGINLSRIESRPADKDKYRFFADLEGNINDQSILSAMEQAAASSDYFEVLGCYSVFS